MATIATVNLLFLDCSGRLVVANSLLDHVRPCLSGTPFAYTSGNTTSTLSGTLLVGEIICGITKNHEVYEILPFTVFSFHHHGDTLAVPNLPFEHMKNLVV
jgi:hypothetical protein